MKIIPFAIALMLYGTSLIACEEVKGLNKYKEGCKITTEDFKEFFESNNNPNAIIEGLGSTAFHIAAIVAQDPKLISLVFEAGGDPNILDENGNTPLHLAVNKNTNPAVIAKLISLGADPNIRMVNSRDMTTLNLALHNENPDILRALLEGGADPMQEGQDGRLAIHWAASLDSSREKIEILVEATGDVDARSREWQFTPLHFSAFSGDNTDTIDIWLDLGADIQAKDLDGYSPLHRAVGTNDNVEMIKHLLEVGADPNAAGDNGYTPLHRSCIMKNPITTIDMLVDAGANLDARTVADESVLYNSLYCGDKPEIFVHLLEAGADANSMAKYDETILHHAAKQVEMPTIVQALLDNGADPNVMDNRGNKAVYHALRATNYDVLKILIDVTDNPFAPDKDGLSLIESAWYLDSPPEIKDMLLEKEARSGGAEAIYRELRFGNPDIEKVRYFLDLGADPNIPFASHTSEGNTALINALRYRADEELIKLLLESGADVNAASTRGHTPLHEIAAHAVNIEYLDTMISAGADVNAQDDNLLTPLHTAAYAGEIESIDILVRNGADINAVEENGRTPLIHALHSPQNQNDIINILIPATDLSLTDETQKTALHLAVINGRPTEMISNLLEYGIDPNAKDHNDLIAIQYALNSNFGTFSHATKDEIIALLLPVTDLDLVSESEREALELISE